MSGARAALQLGAHLEFSTDEDGKEVLIITDEQLSKEGRNVLEMNKEAAEVCPVQVIHIYDEESGEKLI